MDTNEDRQELIDHLRRADSPSEAADAFARARGWLLEHPDDESVRTAIQELFTRADAFSAG